ncbi:MAG: ankyrin repeat domain-containing protein [Candidatus Babeliales bacterium]|jgi:ankyrin repeat protein
MKNKLMYTFLALLVGSGIINSSDCDSPTEGSSSSAFGQPWSPFSSSQIPAARQAPQPVRRAAPVIIPPKELTQLHHVVNRDDVDLVETMLINTDDVNVEDKYGITPLHIAVTRNKLEVVRALLAKRHSVKNLNKALHYARDKRNPALVQMLVDAGADASAQVVPSCSTLHVAARIGHQETVSDLIAQGANLNALDNEHIMFPLTYAIEEERTEIMKTLLDHGARSSILALSDAVKYNKLQSVKTLLAAGADAKGKDLDLTVLERGIYAGCQLPIIEALIQNGADVNISDTRGDYSPLLVAVRSGRTDYVRVLLAAGANPNNNSRYFNILNLAIKSKKPEILKMLIAARANVNPSFAHISPLKTAIYESNSVMVQDLLTADARLNNANECNSELRLAVRGNNLAIVEMLVDAGANVNVSDEHYSALAIAKRNNNAAMIDYLESKGAVSFWGESCSIQ